MFTEVRAVGGGVASWETDALASALDPDVASLPERLAICLANSALASKTVLSSDTESVRGFASPSCKNKKFKRLNISENYVNDTPDNSKNLKFSGILIFGH
jgi:hypothetical protein